MKKFILFVLLLLVFISYSYSQTFYDFTSDDLEGNPVTLSKLLQKGPVMISFWATWCTPCKEEMKKMQDIYEKYKGEGFSYIAINQDDQKSVCKVKSYISAKNYTFIVVLDTDKKIFEAYSGTGVPYSLLINKNKEIVAKHIGYVTGDEVKIEQEIKSALETSGDTKK